MKLPGILKKLIVLLFWIGVWWGISALVNREVLVPSPVSVAGTFLGLLGKGSFYINISLSVLRIMAGLALGIVCGILFAVLCALSPLLSDFVSPVLSVIRATPVASFIILALVIINKEIIPVFISFLMVFPVIFGNVRTGIAKTDAELLEMAVFFGVPKNRILKDIYFHQVSPYFFAGVKTCLGLAWKAGVAAEVLCFPVYSIGKQLYNSKVYLETSELFAWTIVVIVISMLIEAGVARLIAAYENKTGKLTGGTDAKDQHNQ